MIGTDYEPAMRNAVLDRAVPCHCGAQIGDPCIGLERGIVHFGRRLKRLLAGIGKSVYRGRERDRVQRKQDHEHSLLNHIRGEELYARLAKGKRSRRAPRGSYEYRPPDPGRTLRIARRA